MDRSMIDAASGGALVDLTPVAAKNLISNMAANSQQFRTQADQNPRHVNEVNHSSLEHKVEELMSLMRQFITGSHQQIKSCGICSNIDHATDMCPTLHEESCQQANATGVFPGPAQRKYDPYSNFYNPGWRDHPNLCYGNNQMNHNQYRPPFQPQPQSRPSVIQNSNPPIEDIVKMLVTNTL